MEHYGFLRLNFKSLSSPRHSFLRKESMERYIPQQRFFIAAWYECFRSPLVVHQKFRQKFGRNSHLPKRATIIAIHLIGIGEQETFLISTLDPGGLDVEVQLHGRQDHQTWLLATTICGVTFVNSCFGRRHTTSTIWSSEFKRPLVRSTMTVVGELSPTFLCECDFVLSVVVITSETWFKNIFRFAKNVLWINMRVFSRITSENAHFRYSITEILIFTILSWNLQCSTPMMCKM